MKYLSVILGIVIGCLLLCYWQDSKGWKAERQRYVLNDSLLQKKILDTRDSANRQIVAYDVVAINTDQLLASASAENEQLRKDLAHVNGKIEKVLSSTTVASTTRDTIRIPVDQFISIKDTGIKKIALSYHPDTFISAIGVSTFRVVDTGIHYLSTEMALDISNSATVTYFNKSKFLGKQKLQLLVTQDNPHTTTGKVQTYYIQPDRKLPQKWWFNVAFGAVATLVTIHFLK